MNTLSNELSCLELEPVWCKETTQGVMLLAGCLPSNHDSGEGHHGMYTRFDCSQITEQRICGAQIKEVKGVAQFETPISTVHTCSPRPSFLCQMEDLLGGFQEQYKIAADPVSSPG